MNSKSSLNKLDAITFENRFTRELPVDVEAENFRRQVEHACYSRVLPTPVACPQLVAYSQDVANLLGISVDSNDDLFAQVFAGNQQLPGMDPYATCYGGHQFGHWAGQLGDGRAINLGEIVNQNKERWTLQLKGAGPTPYSRTADGLAVLRSSLREFLCSEAMFHLGVPTTRALSLVLTGEEVLRDMLYDGNPKHEPGAIACRVARSFTRFGNFEIFAARGEIDTLKQFLDFTIRTDFPHLGAPSPEVYAAWFEEVCRTTAEMIVHWMRVGFVHGVMNTDNMSILGLTIDYGPYGWLEDYNPEWTPNTTDASQRRYRFGNQPKIALWNLAKLANTLIPLLEDVKSLEQGLHVYSQTFQDGWQSMMAQKLGLNSFELETDDDLTNELMEVLQLVETDMTIFFRKLALLDINMSDLDNKTDEELMAPLMDAYYVPEQLNQESRKRTGDWIRNYIIRLDKDGTPNDIRCKRMNAVNPKYVLRNYLAQLAIDKTEQGDFTMVNELLELLQHPYDEQPDKEAFAKKRPDWARYRAGCSMLSCSS